MLGRGIHGLHHRVSQSKGHNLIMVIDDRLTKYAYFIALSHPFTASIVAKVLMENIQKLHVTPKVIVSDRDPIFTSHFWKDLVSCLVLNWLIVLHTILN